MGGHGKRGLEYHRPGHLGGALKDYFLGEWQQISHRAGFDVTKPLTVTGDAHGEVRVSVWIDEWVVALDATLDAEKATAHVRLQTSVENVSEREFRVRRQQTADRLARTVGVHLSDVEVGDYLLDHMYVFLTNNLDLVQKLNFAGLAEITGELHLELDHRGELEMQVDGPAYELEWLVAPVKAFAQILCSMTEYDLNRLGQVALLERRLQPWNLLPVRDRALARLAILEEPAPEAVSIALEDPSPELATRAAATLRQWGSPAAIAPALRALPRVWVEPVPWSFHEEVLGYLKSVGAGREGEALVGVFTGKYDTLTKLETPHQRAVDDALIRGLAAEDEAIVGLVASALSDRGVVRALPQAKVAVETVTGAQPHRRLTDAIDHLSDMAAVPLGLEQWKALAKECGLEPVVVPDWDAAGECTVTHRTDTWRVAARGVVTEGAQRTARFTFKAVIPNLLRFRFRIRESAGASFLSLLGAINDTLVGDPDFDKRFVVDTNLTEPMRTLFTAADMERLTRVRAKLEMVLVSHRTGTFGPTIPPDFGELTLIAFGNTRDLTWVASCAHAFIDLVKATTEVSVQLRGEVALLDERLRAGTNSSLWPWWRGLDSQQAALARARELGDPRSVHAVGELLEDPNPYLALSAAETLIELGSKEAIAPGLRAYTRAWKDYNERFGEMVFELLRSLGAAPEAAAIRAIAKDSDPTLAIELETPHARAFHEALLSLMLYHSASRIVAAIAQTFRERGALGMLPALRRLHKERTDLLDSAQDEIANAITALEALARLPQTSNAPLHTNRLPQPAGSAPPETGDLPRPSTTDNDEL